MYKPFYFLPTRVLQDACKWNVYTPFLHQWRCPILRYVFCLRMWDEAEEGPLWWGACFRVAGCTTRCSLLLCIWQFVFVHPTVPTTFLITGSSKLMLRLHWSSSLSCFYSGSRKLLAICSLVTCKSWKMPMRTLQLFHHYPHLNGIANQPLSITMPMRGGVR